MNIFRERFKGKMFNSLQQEFQFVRVCVCDCNKRFIFDLKDIFMSILALIEIIDAQRFLLIKLHLRTVY